MFWVGMDLSGVGYHVIYDHYDLVKEVVIEVLVLIMGLCEITVVY